MLKAYTKSGARLVFTRKSMEREDQDEQYTYSSRKDKAEGEVVTFE